MRARRSSVAGIAVVLVLAAAAALAGYAGMAARRPGIPPPRPTPGAPSQLAAAARRPPLPGAQPATVTASVTSAGVRSALRTSLDAAGLGGRLRADVIDVASGSTLLDRDAGVAVAPASTAKLLTAAALLAVRAPTDRLITTVRAGAGGTVVLVGGGDPTLSGAPAGAPTRYAGAARLASLATALRASGVRVTRIMVDDSLFTGPAASPAWAAEDLPSDYAAPIRPLIADGGRAAPGDVLRSTEPDLAAGRELAAMLGRASMPVVRASAHSTGRVLATVASAPLRTLIAQTLQLSDNVLAECLARQVAIAEHAPPTFLGAAQAVRTVLARLGVRAGAGLVDASGLAARDRVTPAVLAAVIRLATRTPRLRTLIAALPVAGWTGTLAGRYHERVALPAEGTVRAKSGTLTGVSALAGIVHTAGGALLAFAFVADRTRSTAAAQAALDAITGRLAACGC